jgi:hypothetical protein
VAESPYVKRYALVLNGSNNGVRRYRLARMEAIAARERLSPKEAPGKGCVQRNQSPEPQQ